MMVAAEHAGQCCWDAARAAAHFPVCMISPSRFEGRRVQNVWTTRPGSSRGSRWRRRALTHSTISPPIRRGGRRCRACGPAELGHSVSGDASDPTIEPFSQERWLQVAAKRVDGVAGSQVGRRRITPLPNPYVGHRDPLKSFAALARGFGAGRAKLQRCFALVAWGARMTRDPVFRHVAPAATQNSRTAPV